MILQYLSDEGYYSSRTVVHDEANVKWQEREERAGEAKRLKKAILGECPLNLVINFRSPQPSSLTDYVFFPLVRR